MDFEGFRSEIEDHLLELRIRDPKSQCQLSGVITDTGLENECMEQEWSDSHGSRPAFDSERSDWDF